METRKGVELATQIFIEHEPAIRAMIRRHVGNKDEEDDIYQNLYLSLVSNPVPFPLANTLAYLSTVIKNDIIDAARRRKSYQEMISRYAISRMYDETETDPQAVVIRGEEMQQIAAFVESLPAHEARAVAERYGYGHTTTDAAKRMSVKERTVSRYLCIGLRHIRQALAGFDIEESICR